MKCFECKEHGHVATRYPKNLEVNAVTAQYEKKNKEVSIDSYKYITLIHKGSDLTLMHNDEYVELGAPRLGIKKIQFEGVGGSQHETMGEFSLQVTIDGLEHSITFHIVPGNVMKHAILLGKDFIDQVDLHIVEGEITIRKPEKEHATDIPVIYRIETVNDSETIDLSHINEQEHRKEIHKLKTLQIRKNNRCEDKN